MVVKTAIVSALAFHILLNAFEVPLFFLELPIEQFQFASGPFDSVPAPIHPLLVALFYLPVYQCTELGYFDTAKHTSGVGEGAAPKDPGSFDSGWGGF